MRSLLSLVCEAEPGFEGTDDDPVMAPPAASLNHIASGNRPFNSDIAEPVLRQNFEPYGLVAKLQERSQPQLERMAEAIHPFEPSITWDRVPEWCADYFTRALTAAVSNRQLVEDAQEKVRRIQTVAAHKRLGQALQMEAGSTCPALGCMDQLLQVNDQGVAVPSFEVTVIDPAGDPRSPANLIALCPHHHAMHTGTNPQAVQELKAIKDRLVSQFKSRLTMSPEGMEQWIRQVLEKIVGANRVDLHQPITEPLAVETKIPDDFMLQETVLAHVATWYAFIEATLKQIDYSDGWDFDEIRHSINSQYRRLKRLGIAQDDVFAQLTQWLQTTTGGKPIACQAVVSYFIQKCDVFEAPQPPATSGKEPQYALS
ncbi:ABC-three component system protein [Arcanobacterium pinnipediorum]|uniref:ABC-three component systems C-terminal domain-containing protein n=1 Tax=Arcanobacterium pinnipediorum TaxID=1503041 RepID=A0ABY5AI27_9ACTO|nr:ABC-three component system protein [Arcanobacterium pinnipediorum]USR79848.1 hypothetical protein NG665_02375 [Arcanobacterium pinnipediorum]